MKVILLHCTPFKVVIQAIRTCWASEELSDSQYFKTVMDYKVFLIGDKDKALIRKIIECGHTSTLEHITFNFEIDGISRAILQELARHRIASLSVQSTRYTLKKLSKEINFEDMLVQSGNNMIDDFNKQRLVLIQTIIQNNLDLSNDIIKYLLPEAFRTKLIWSINARSLRNFLKLRLSPKAHFEIRNLAREIYKQIPEEYNILFENLGVDFSGI